MRVLPANTLRLMILRALAASPVAMSTRQIYDVIDHDNEASVYSAMRPLARLGLVAVHSRIRIAHRTGLTRPLYVITPEGREWIRAQQTAEARKALKARRGRKAGHSARALLEVWQ